MPNTSDRIEQEIEDLKKELDDAVKEFNQLKYPDQHTKEERDIAYQMKIVADLDRRMQQYVDDIDKARDQADSTGARIAQDTLRDTLKRRRGAWDKLDKMQKELEKRFTYLRRDYIPKLQHRISQKTKEYDRAVRDEEKRDKAA
jgi:hypothetical protein